MEFKPSQYQLDIFEFVKYGYGNAVISAVAGSGKSTVIIKCLDYLKSDKRVLFLAFNNSIVKELGKKITRDNTDVKTLHSLGFSILKYNFKEKSIEIFEDKYKNKMREILIDLGSTRLNDKKYTKNILKLCDLGRFYLSKTKLELLAISNKYSLTLIEDEIDIALQLINWGKTSLNNSNLIDFTDMVYLPNVLNLKVFKYDFIIIDEAQDLSISQMALFLKCFKQGSRFIAVGDESQTIYGFSGSDIESFNKLKKLPNTIELPLSICYRCPKNIVKFVQKFVPEIEFSETAIDGVINFNAKIEDLIDGDMVICRNTLPLVKLYIKLISKNIKCYIKGVDIGLNLLDMISYIDEEELNVDLKNPGVFSKLSESLLEYIETNVSLTDLSVIDITSSQEYNDLVDKIECLKIISIGINTKTDLIDKITGIFSDEEKQGICLSTIHKAKGLEADNVYVLNKNLMPSKFVKQNWELEQEENIQYVAYTRPKKVLGFIQND